MKKIIENLKQGNNIYPLNKIFINNPIDDEYWKRPSYLRYAYATPTSTANGSQPFTPWFYNTGDNSLNYYYAPFNEYKNGLILTPYPMKESFSFYMFKTNLSLTLDSFPVSTYTTPYCCKDTHNKKIYFGVPMLPTEYTFLDKDLKAIGQSQNIIYKNFYDYLPKIFFQENISEEAQGGGLIYHNTYGFPPFNASASDFVSNGAWSFYFLITHNISDGSVNYTWRYLLPYNDSWDFDNWNNSLLELTEPNISYDTTTSFQSLLNDISWMSSSPIRTDDKIPKIHYSFGRASSAHHAKISVQGFLLYKYDYTTSSAISSDSFSGSDAKIFFYKKVLGLNNFTSSTVLIKQNPFIVGCCHESQLKILPFRTDLTGESRVLNSSSSANKIFIDFNNEKQLEYDRGIEKKLNKDELYYLIKTNQLIYYNENDDLIIENQDDKQSNLLYFTQSEIDEIFNS